MILLPLKEWMPAQPIEPGQRSPYVAPSALGRILDQLDAVPLAACLDRGDVRRLTIKVDEHERLRGPPGPGLRLDGGAGERRIHVPAALLAVDEDRTGAEVGDRRGRGDEGEVGAQHLVAGTDAGQAEGEVQGGGAGRERDGVRRADQGRELLLERVDVRPTGATQLASKASRTNSTSAVPTSGGER